MPLLLQAPLQVIARNRAIPSQFFIKLLIIFANWDELIVTKTISIFSMQDVDIVVSSGAQKAIKEMAQGEGREK